MRSKKLVPFIFLSFFYSFSVFSAEVRIDGFASLVGGMVLDKDEGEIYFYSEEDLTFDADSVYGIQVRGDLEKDLSVTAQIVGRGENDYEAEFEWAFASYQINDELRVSVGKTRSPIYMYSDFLDVSYSYHWIRPPRTVYEVPFNTLEGVNVEYLTDVGEWTSRLTLVAGATEAPVGELSSTLTVRNAIGAAWSMNYDWLTLRAVLLSANTGVAFVDDPNDSEDLMDLINGIKAANGIFAGGEAGISAALMAAGAPDSTFDDFVGAGSGFDTSDLVDDIEWMNDRGIYQGVAATIDYNDFLFVAEYTRIDIEDSFIPELNSYYISLGKRFNDWMVHLTYEVDDDKPIDSIIDDAQRLFPVYVRTGTTGNPLYDGIMDGGIAELNTGREQIIAGISSAVKSLELEKETWTLGVRWDFHPSASIKAEYKYKDDTTNSKKPRLIIFGLDLVF